MSIELNTDLSTEGGTLNLVPPSRAFTLEGIVDEYLLGELQEPVTKADYDAKHSAHRYKRRTGKLQAGTHVKMEKVTASEQITSRIEAYVEEQVDYAPYVIKGHGTWAPDKFIDKALDMHTAEIEQAVDVAIAKGIDYFFTGNDTGGL